MLRNRAMENGRLNVGRARELVARLERQPAAAREHIGALEEIVAACADELGRLALAWGCERRRIEVVSVQFRAKQMLAREQHGDSECGN